MLEHVTWNHLTPLGTPVYAIDDKHRSIPGTLQARYGPYVAIETDLGPCRRRRIFHARYVTVDLWANLRDLP